MGRGSWRWNGVPHTELVSQLPCLKVVKVPWCLRKQQPVKCNEVVTFVDALQQTFEAVSYLRSKYEEGSITTWLIASNRKVAPLTPITVPRLELISAIFGLRLTQSISRALEVLLKAAAFYADSRDVLWWIRGWGRDFGLFVGLVKYKCTLIQLNGSTFPLNKI